MITTQAQVDQNAADYAAAWPTEGDDKKAAPATPNPAAFYTTEEIEAKKLEQQQQAARKA